LYAQDESSVLVLPFFILLGIVQTMAPDVRAGVFLLLTFANPATVVSIANLGRFSRSH